MGVEGQDNLYAIRGTVDDMGIEGQDNLYAIRATGRRYGIAALNFLGIHGDSIVPLQNTF
jgi:hypothetical protein